MSAAEKAQWLSTMQNQKWLTEDDAGEIARSSMSDDLGVPPNPHREHIDRCIADWCEGPPKGWMETVQADQQKLAAWQQQAQMLGAQQQQQGLQGPQIMAAIQQQIGPQPQPQEYPTPFMARANDEEPIVAKYSYLSLSKLMSTAEYRKHPKEWRELLNEKYQQARYAAGVFTVREQQQQQQQAAQAQAQAAAQGQNAPPQWGEFVKKIEATVVNAAASEVAKVVEGEALGMQDAPADPSIEAHQAAADHEHDAGEAQRDRDHELTKLGLEHAHEERQNSMKTAATVGASLAKAGRQSARAQGVPTPGTRPEQQ
jgi:hypothetical protein